MMEGTMARLERVWKTKLRGYQQMDQMNDSQGLHALSTSVLKSHHSGSSDAVAQSSKVADTHK